VIASGFVTETVRKPQRLTAFATAATVMGIMTAVFFWWTSPRIEVNVSGSLSSADVDQITDTVILPGSVYDRLRFGAYRLSRAIKGAPTERTVLDINVREDGAVAVQVTTTLGSFQPHHSFDGELRRAPTGGWEITAAYLH
jgi:hypothetical protein